MYEINYCLKAEKITLVSIKSKILNRTLGINFIGKMLVSLYVYEKFRNRKW